MYTPTLDQVKQLAGQGNLVPVYTELNADLETPVSAYLKVARPPYSFLLESVEGGERLARYSFIGTEPLQVIKTGPGQPGGAVDPLTRIEEALGSYTLAPVSGLPRFTGGAVGYLAYEVVRYFEQLPSPEIDTIGLPESLFMIAGELLVFDHLKHKIQVVSHAFLDGNVEQAYAEATARIDALVERLRQPLQAPPQTLPINNGPHQGAPFSSNRTEGEYEAVVERIKQYIVAGDCIQVVPSQRLARKTTAHPFDIYRALRGINPSPYMYYLALDDFHIVGTSPELLVRVEDGEVVTHPIAGTRPRGATPEEEAALEQDLRSDEKEQAEHIMLVDLGRNDIGRVSQPGTVRVPQLMDVERYSHVLHLVSHVTGRLKPEMSCYDALRACFPAGTVSGAPKIRAMEIIAELEPSKRSLYAGAVGYFSFSGNMDTAIAIRTAVVKDGMAYVQAGGGVVYDSVPKMEYQETLHKASAMLRAIDEAEARGG